MVTQVTIISSMATRKLLADLVAQFHRTSTVRVVTESVGGVDAAKRVQAGEAFDIVVLAVAAIDKLVQAGRIVAGSRVDLVKSGVALAVRAGATRPDIGSEDAVRRAVLAARSLSYSTGPSGDHLAQLFTRWGVADALRERVVMPPPGVPVGSLVADGRVELGFQQYSELMNLPGIDVVGPLPPQIQIVTVFSAGLAATSTQPEAVRSVLEFMASPAAVQAKRDNGMEPA